MPNELAQEPKTPELGDRVRDTISGFEGIVTCKAVYMHGCVQLLLSPTMLDKDGKLIKGCWFDEPQVELVVSGNLKEAPPKHGPREHPLERNDE